MLPDFVLNVLAVRVGVVLGVVITAIVWIMLSWAGVLPDWMDLRGCGERGEFCEPLEGWER